MSGKVEIEAKSDINTVSIKDRYAKLLLILINIYPFNFEGQVIRKHSFVVEITMS